MVEAPSTLDLTFKQTVDFLCQAEDLLIMAHAAPDGDTIGSAYGLCLGLRQLGKRARVLCADPLPTRFAFLKLPEAPDFEPKEIVCVDIADPKLAGKANASLAWKSTLCIDHHGSNIRYAQRLYLEPEASSTCEIMVNILERMGVSLTSDIADCLYTGMATDTGCFRFGNTQASTHRTAAKLMECGAHAAKINKDLFDTIGRTRFVLEQLVGQTMQFYLGGRVAVIQVAHDMCVKTGTSDSELEGFASMPARIEGVLVGVTLREKVDGFYKISLRTNEGIDASAICAKFDGGGHKAAAGCKIKGSLEHARKLILEAIEEALG